MKSDACSSDPAPSCSSATGDGPLGWFERMIPNCLAYARQMHAEGRPIVGILCEYAPRELLLAAGAVPVCLCGGSAATIAPAEQYLPVSLCPLIKSTFGYHVQKSNPFLEMADLVVAETTCDGKKKMYELMGESRPMFVLHLPHRPEHPASLAAWKAELLRLAAALERRFHVRIETDRLRAAIAVMNRERQLRRQLAETMKSDHPPLTGRQLLSLKSSISGVPEHLPHYEAVFRSLCNARKNCGCSQPVRVLMTGVPMAHGAERVLELIEQCGGLVVCMDTCVGLKPILQDVDEQAEDPFDALAAKYLDLPCAVMTSNDQRLRVLEQLATEYRPECVIELIWQGCTVYEVESRRIARLCEQQLGLPYLRIETDYSPSDQARITNRVEALFETVRGAGQIGSQIES